MLEVFFSPMGFYPLKGEVLMVVACVTLRLSLRKGVYVGHIQWGRRSKALTEWANIYGAGVLEMGDTNFQGTVKSSLMQLVPLEGHGLESSLDDIICG